MSDETGTYRMLREPVEQVIFKERKSKFIGYAYPVRSEQEISAHLEELKQRYADANHICYAWKLGVSDPTYRVQDDGEPRNSAGVPIYGQINSLELTNIVVFVVRYFGGVKLGVGGLISAYRETARSTLEEGKVQELSVSCGYRLTFNYSQMNAVERLISRMELEVVKRDLQEEALFVVEVPLSKKSRFLEAIHSFYKVDVDEVTEN
ncbi:IMPACT family protein [Lentiprolixibacter aurantiacus]|uniref:YigZ family protein n=1 Tax=Lentiprolixibacter aurantiacus TaxID=2993939 RepID=A0AAE3MM23_9FLAO|nr:YigZ family protein [Lentiprolixibacter aurantiacus]MCX2719364.1 YigZ family protein [Lentiprolixibacter aurantiacus]